MSSEESRSAAVERSNRSFRAFVAASAAVGAAAGALPVILAFAVLDVTRSAADLGLVLAVQAITSLGLSLLGGVVADRHALRHLLVGSVLLRLVVAAGFAAVLLAGWAQLWELLVVAVGYGIADSVYTPASSAVLPRLVATDRLTTANSTLTSASSLSALLAPAAAGGVIALGGVGFGFVADAAAMAIAALALLVVIIPPLPAHQPPETLPVPSLFGDLRHGWQEFRSRGWLWGLTLQWAVYALAVLGPVTVIGPVLAKQYLGGAAAWGLIATSLGLGLIGGTIVVRRLRLRRPALVVAVVVLVLPAEAAALAVGAPLGLVIAAATFTGVATGIVTVTTQAIMQRNVPAAVLARVSAFDLVGSEVTLPLGYALAGVVAASSETGPVLLIGSGMLWATTVAIIIAIPAVRSLRQSRS